MASLHKQAGNRPGYKLRFRDGSNRQRVLWLGNVSKRNADSIARHVSELVRAFGAGVAPEMDSAKWANELGGRLRQKLAELGYVGAERRSVSNADAVRLCGPFFENYIKSRTDWTAQTINNYSQAVTHFNKHVGASRLLSDVTPADIDGWRRWMVTEAKRPATKDEPAVGLAIATANKHSKRLRKLFSHAVRSKLITENPVDCKIGGEVNRDRDFYIDQATASKVIKLCQTEDNHEWALIFGLCRYAGLRCPTEVLSLTWADVDWESKRLRVDSTKTGLRFCPIFPELRLLLEAAFNDAPEGALHCVRSYRGSESNLRSQFARILVRAGVVPWQKPFVNLRASCRTDLQERFPDHVINTWLGQSSRVAEKHYLQTTDAHWERAVVEPEVTTEVGVNAGGNIGANLGKSATGQGSKKPNKNKPQRLAEACVSSERHPREDSNL